MIIKWKIESIKRAIIFLLFFKFGPKHLHPMANHHRYLVSSSCYSVIMKMDLNRSAISEKKKKKHDVAETRISFMDTNVADCWICIRMVL